jgi:hypothetical protein
MSPNVICFVSYNFRKYWIYMAMWQTKDRRKRTLSYRRTGVSAECRRSDDIYVPKVTSWSMCKFVINSHNITLLMCTHAKVYNIWCYREKLQVIHKSEDARKRIARAIEKSYIFKGLDKEQIKIVYSHQPSLAWQYCCIHDANTIKITIFFKGDKKYINVGLCTHDIRSSILA